MAAATRRETLIVHPNPTTFHVTYTQADAILHALSIGHVHPSRTDETHPKFAPCPSFSTSLLAPRNGDNLGMPTFPPPAMHHLPLLPHTKAMLEAQLILHTHTNLPPTGATLALTSKLVGMEQKRTGVLLHSHAQLHDQRGRIVHEILYSTFAFGAHTRDAHFSGDANFFFPEMRTPPRNVPHDVQVEQVVPENASLLYRLLGDTNPIHIDTQSAQAAGLEHPILHGRCALGVALKAIFDVYTQCNPQDLRKASVRFVAPIRPGQTLHIKMWGGGPKHTTTHTKVDSLPHTHTHKSTHHHHTHNSTHHTHKSTHHTHTSTLFFQASVRQDNTNTLKTVLSHGSLEFKYNTLNRL